MLWAEWKNHLIFRRNTTAGIMNGTEENIFREIRRVITTFREWEMESRHLDGPDHGGGGFLVQENGVHSGDKKEKFVVLSYDNADYDY